MCSSGDVVVAVDKGDSTIESAPTVSETSSNAIDSQYPAAASLDRSIYC